MKVKADAFRQAMASMSEVPFRLVDPTKLLPVDLFLPFEDSQGGVTVRRVFRRGLAPSRSHLRKVRGTGMRALYCRKEEHKTMLGYVEAFTRQSMNSQGMPAEAKCGILYDNARFLVENAFHEDNIERNLRKGMEYCHTLVGVLRYKPEVLSYLSELLVSDYDLYAHSVNVCLLSTAFGDALGMSKADLEYLSTGALYHDIGKRAVDSAIWSKPAKLDRSEWDQVRQHPRFGFTRLKHMNKIPRESAMITLQHHENLDGSGYPLKLRGEDIPFMAQLVRLVDVYDALTSHRTYKEAKRPFDAVKIIFHEMKGKISGVMLKQFLQFMGAMGNNKSGRSKDLVRNAALTPDSRAYQTCKD